ncbi:peptidoglycan-binding protein [Ruegeria sp. HKCCD8929]|uniref:peptidoglycan-binding domain-containing protein n=1 Tax=Ruegeria sp. HKCCD8929 TaxID=2683006 RepID=UPI001489C950|nr:peptidoglycan-binding domain-containing protein [Ruegeria sp. HKCCD8929]
MPYMLRAAIVSFLTLLSTTEQAVATRNIQESQNALAIAGFNPGPEDGIEGSATCRAISTFQITNGLQATGERNAAKCAALHSRSAAPDTRNPPDENLQDLPSVLPRYGVFWQGRRDPRPKN